MCGLIQHGAARFSAAKPVATEVLSRFLVTTLVLQAPWPRAAQGQWADDPEQVG